MKQRLKCIIRMIPATLYVVLIWTLSSNPVNVDISGVDKIIHIAEYAVLGFLLAFGFYLTRANFEKLGAKCFYTGVFLGAVDEIHQLFVPGRSASFLDLFADISGVALGILVWLMCSDFREYLKKNKIFAN